MESKDSAANPSPQGSKSDRLFKLAVVALLGFIAWELYGIRGSMVSLHAMSTFGDGKLSQNHTAVPVFLVNGINVQRIQGIGGDAAFVPELKVVSEIRTPFGVDVNVRNQPLDVKVRN